MKFLTHWGLCKYRYILLVPMKQRVLNKLNYANFATVRLNFKLFSNSHKDRKLRFFDVALFGILSFFQFMNDSHSILVCV